jgi:hypothetical protein
MTTFRFSALSAEAFAPLFALDDDALAARGMHRVVADSKPGFPCRVSLVDAEPGETLLLLHHVHHNVAGPYRASGPIYVRERAAQATPAAGEVPAVVSGRLLSLRAYDAGGWLRDAAVTEGRELEHVIEQLFADADVAYIHVHNARPGCYSCRIDRV